MSTTSQDELDEQLEQIIEYWDFSPLQDEDGRIERIKSAILALIHREQVWYHLAKMKDLLKDVEWIPNGEGRIYSVPMRTIEAKIEAEQKKLKEVS